MKTIKQKLEMQVKKIENQFPELIANQMYLGTKDHPNIKLWNETSSLVGMVTLQKWRKLKYVLNIWNSTNWNSVDSFLRNNQMYYYAKLLREEIKQQKEVA